MIKISSSIGKQIDAASRSLKHVEKSVPQAFSAALNRTAEGTRTEGVRKIKETYQIKYRGLSKEIRITKANPKKLQALLQSNGRNIPLIQFKTTPNKPPRRQPKILKAAVKKGGLKPVLGAFVAKLGQHQPGVFVRTGPERRAPAKELYGPGVPVMMSEDGVVEHMNKEAERRMHDRLDHEMKRVLGRMKQV